MDKIAHTVTNGGECKFGQGDHHHDAAERRLSRARDTSRLAKRMVDVATGLESDIPPEPKGKQIRARATSLTPERRREIDRMAAAARWSRTATNG